MPLWIQEWSTRGLWSQESTFSLTSEPMIKITHISDLKAGGEGRKMTANNQYRLIPSCAARPQTRIQWTWAKHMWEYEVTGTCFPNQTSEARLTLTGARASPADLGRHSLQGTRWVKKLQTRWHLDASLNASTSASISRYLGVTPSEITLLLVTEKTELNFKQHYLMGTMANGFWIQ